MMVLGYIAARYLQTKSEHIAGLMLYIITPVVFFTSVMGTPLEPSTIIAPILVWSICLLNCLLFYGLGKWFLQDNRANLLALAVATGNTGYFGIPVALILLGTDNLSTYVTCMIGAALFENSMGYYIAAKGHYPARECLLKVLRLPALYAFVSACLLNISGLGLPVVFDSFTASMRGAYTVLGMMIIGMSIAGTRRLVFDKTFAGLTFVGKFICWPLWAMAFIALDKALFGIFNDTIYQSLLLISIVPVAANTVVIAIMVKGDSKQVAMVTLLSTLFALCYIPVMSAVLLTLPS